jgi:hypothetical protein
VNTKAYEINKNKQKFESFTINENPTSYQAKQGLVFVCSLIKKPILVCDHGSQIF